MGKEERDQDAEKGLRKLMRIVHSTPKIDPKGGKTPPKPKPKRGK